MTDYERGYIDGLYDAVGELCELISMKVDHYKGEHEIVYDEFKKEGTGNED